MQIGFIMPTDAQKQRIDALNEAILKLMPFQREHFWHLARSWRVLRCHDSLAVLEEALKRTLRDKP